MRTRRNFNRKKVNNIHVVRAPKLINRVTIKKALKITKNLTK